MIRVDCECGHWFSVRDELAGRKGQCACGRVVRIPGQLRKRTANTATFVPAGPEAVPSVPPEHASRPQFAPTGSRAHIPRGIVKVLPRTTQAPPTAFELRRQEPRPAEQFAADETPVVDNAGDSLLDFARRQAEESADTSEVIRSALNESPLGTQTVDSASSGQSAAPELLDIPSSRQSHGVPSTLTLLDEAPELLGAPVHHSHSRWWIGVAAGLLFTGGLIAWAAGVFSFGDRSRSTGEWASASGGSSGDSASAGSPANGQPPIASPAKVDDQAQPSKIISLVPKEAPPVPKEVPPVGPPNRRDPRRNPRVVDRGPPAGNLGTVVGEVQRFNGHTATVRAIALLPDFTRALTVSDDKSVHLWDVQTGNAAGAALGSHADTVAALALSVDGQFAATGGADRGIRIWNLSSKGPPKMLLGHSQAVTALAFSPDGKRLVSAGQDQTVRLWDVDAGKVLNELKIPNGSALAVAFSPDGAFFAAGGEDKNIRIWNAAAQPVATLKGHGASIHGLIFSADGTRLISAAGRYSLNQNEHIDCTVRIWDVAGKKEVRTLEGHEDAVNSVAISADGKRILSGSDDKTLRIWNADTGDEIQKFDGHSEAVLAVGFSKDGRYAVSASADKTGRVWLLEKK